MKLEGLCSIQQIFRDIPAGDVLQFVQCYGDQTFRVRARGSSVAHISGSVAGAPAPSPSVLVSHSVSHVGTVGENIRHLHI